ncbi:MAG TPA: MerR family transcriptional regulator [Thermoanaerobaculia bacterium]|jgi:hypothetical protein|nr:MerR family transcriptional regulator [Thermoanaerobaculia bacterium]
MAPKARVQKRLYYKIGEACKALGIQPYVLRYWETEFPALSPSKSRSGQRVYSEKELEIIRRIKQLLYDEGYTIAGAKKKLEGELAAGTLGESAGAALTPPGAAGAGGGAGPAGAGSPAAPLIFQGPGAATGAAARAEAASAPVGTGTGTGGGAGAGPIRTVPLPLVPLAPAAVAPGTAADPASPESASGRVGRSTLPLEPPAPPAVEMPVGSQTKAAGASAAPGAGPRNAAGAKGPVAPLAPVAPVAAMPDPAADRDSGTGASAGPPPAGPARALDTDAAKRIETLRKGILKALQEAREILALLDSRTPQ